MPLQATSGAASYDGFGGGVAAVPNYIEDVFSTYLWATAQPTTIVNGIDLATKGGMVWTKLRNSADNNRIWDSARGPTKRLITDSTAAQVDEGIYGAVFNTNGFTDRWFGSGYNATSWTFRKQPKFFDVVTYTGNGTAGRTVAHSLGSVPGCMIVKAYSVDTGDFWAVYHRSLGATKAIFLSATNAAATSSIYWNNTEPTSTNFTVGDWSGVNQSGTSYVAYLFAHNAGGFGLTGTDNVISCGSFVGTGTANTPTVTLGYEPQWLLIKKIDGTISTSASSWTIWDTMRGITTGGNDSVLWANLSDAESTPNAIQVTSTGFQIETSGAFYNQSGATYIYIAIRKGPMKVPTSGTSVFGAGVFTGVGTTTKTLSSGQLGYYDQTWFYSRDYVTYPFNRNIQDRLRGGDLPLATSSTSGDTGLGASSVNFAYNGNSVNLTATTMLDIGTPYVMYAFKRAPSFMDTVCYTGTGAAATRTHNLGVAPELMIIKKRSAVGNWVTYVGSLGATKYMYLNTTGTPQTDSGGLYFNNTTPTATSFYTGAGSEVNASGATFAAYLFASCPGVSKVGSYTGNGSSQTINCGFTGGARFVMIRRTDGIRDWNYWDSARGIISGNDPYLALNNTAAEVTTTDAVDPDNSGFTVNHGTSADVNAGGGATYIFLAIA